MTPAMPPTPSIRLFISWCGMRLCNSTSRTPSANHEPPRDNESYSVLLMAMATAGCISPPAPKYQAAIANTEILIKQSTKFAVEDFTAAAGVSNHSLGMGIRSSTAAAMVRSPPIYAMR